MIQGTRLNRIASFLALGVMGVAIAFGANALQSAREGAAMPAEGTLVVANLRAETLTFHYLAGRREPATLAVPGPPHEFAELGGRLYVTLGRGNAVAEVDPLGPAVLRVLPLEGEPHGIAVVDGAILVTLDERDEAVTVNPETLAVTGRVSTGDTPHTVAAAAGEVYVTDSRDNRLRLLGSGETAATGPLPESVAITGGFVLTADAQGGTVSLFTRVALQPLGQARVGSGPVRVVALSGTTVLVAVTGEDRMVVLDVSRAKVDRRVRTGARPDGICISPSGRHVAVAANGAGSVRVFEADGWRAAGDLEAGDGPGACAWLAGR